MCRWLIYKGAPILIGKLTHEPEHSLMSQAKDGGFYPGCHDPDQQRNIRVNGDGFGLAWYSSSPLVPVSAGACAFRCITPVRGREGPQESAVAAHFSSIVSSWLMARSRPRPLVVFVAGVEQLQLSQPGKRLHHRLCLSSHPPPPLPPR